MGECTFHGDAGSGYNGNSVLEADAGREIGIKRLLTKDELRQKLQSGAKMEDMFKFRAGQECDIFKAEDFISGEEILYIPDLDLNEIPTERPVSGPEEIDDILHSCYTGNDFIEECHGDVDLAIQLFWYCDWHHPSSALPEVEDKDE